MLKNKLLKKLFKIWVGNKLPDVHVFPENKGTINKRYFKQIIIHPLKRRLAKYYLIFLRMFFDIKVIGITGSAGKTTTKEMLASILKESGEVVSSYKNIDPVYNIPDTILRCCPSTKYLVLEMGVEYPGEMAFYIWLAKPDVSVITNINPTHLLYFLDIQGVLKEKKLIATSLGSNSCAVINHSDPNLSKIKKDIKAKILPFGKGTKIYATEIKITKSGTFFTLSMGGRLTKIKLPLVGEHFVSDALAAVSVASVFNLKGSDIKKGLGEYNIPEHRMNIFNGEKGTLIIDDTYNNNPKAAQEALKVFEKLSAGKVRGIVFGDMLELGDQSEYYHHEIGKIISGLKIDFLVCLGTQTEYLIDEVKKTGSKIDMYKTTSTGQVYKLIQKYLGKNTVVLLKGSRAVALDKVAEKLSK